MCMRASSMKVSGLLLKSHESVTGGVAGLYREELRALEGIGGSLGVSEG